MAFRIYLLLTVFALSACGQTLSSFDASGYGHTAYVESVQDDLETLKAKYDENPDSFYYAQRYAVGKYNAGEYEQVLTIFKPFLVDPLSSAVRPDDILFYAQVLRKLERTDEAILWMKKAIETAPDYLSARMILADFYEEQKMFGEAEALYNDALSDERISSLSKKEVLELQLALATNYAQQERFKEATDYLYTLKKADKDNQEIERNLRIMRAMMQSNGHSAPKPMPRPKL